MKKLLACLVLSVTLAACVPAPGAVGHWSDAPAEVQAEHSPEVIQAYIDAYWRNVWVQTYNYRKWMAAAVAYEARKAQGPPYVDGIEVCNGVDLPTCGIVYRESRYDPRARNRSSSAGGLYQFLWGTWRSVCPEYASYGNAANAPVSVQVECARRLWAGGAGSGHWRLTR